MNSSAESKESSSDSSGAPTRPAPPVVKGGRRIIYAIAAGMFLVLGALGAVLPLLPTTPFLLLASFFLIRISPAANQALLRSKFFGPILVDWQQNGGVRPDVKVKASVVVVAAVALSIWLTGRSPFVSALVCVLAGTGLIVIWKLPVANLTHPGTRQAQHDGSIRKKSTD